MSTLAVERHRSFYEASRALAMGDAFTAYGQGFESVYYNPAGVARRTSPQLKYFDMELGGSYSLVSYIRGNLTSFYSLKELGTQLAASQPDTLTGLFFGFTPQFLAKNFSIGMVVKSSFDAIVDGTTADLNIFSTSDLALYLHYGVSLFGGVVKFGVGAKALDRAELDRTYTTGEYSTGAISFSSQWKEGIGYGVDAGVLITSPTAGLPTLGIAVQDIGATTLRDRRVLWTGSKGTPGAPPRLEQRINVGGSITTKHDAGLKSVFSVEVKDLERFVDNMSLEHWHAGWELNVNDIVRLRAGVNQGIYWTAGLGIQFVGFALDLSTWGENLYAFTGQKRELRYYVGKYTLAF